MQDFQERVIRERAELEAKMEKLTTFRLSEQFKKLDAEEQALLTRQQSAMADYAKILTTRINRFNLTPADNHRAASIDVEARKN